MAAARDADARTATLAGTAVPLTYAATDTARTVDFRGYAYTRTPSEISGAPMTRYDETSPQIWKVPLRDEIVPALSVNAPRLGYVVPAAHASWVGKKLAQHGIAFKRIAAGVEAADVRTFRADTATFATASVEGQQPLTLAGQWKNETLDIGDGALLVPIAQPKARLVIALLEPQAPDSLAAWGMFNNHYERKEYMEAYVAEQVAREMLAADPALKAEFERQLRDDAEFAASPQARLEFFYRRHTAWDERYRLYPVYQVDALPGH